MKIDELVYQSSDQPELGYYSTGQSETPWCPSDLKLAQIMDWG